MSIQISDFLALTLPNKFKLKAYDFVFPSGRAYIEDTGILRFEPNVETEISLVISTGIHGNETGPIELINKMVKAILDGELMLNVRLLVLIGNPFAAVVGKRFCDVNLNRLFSGAWRNYEGIEVQRAQRLEQSVSDFFDKAKQDSSHLKLHYDLHTAIRGSQFEKFAVAPYVKDGVYNQTQFNFLTSCGIDAVLLSHQATTTFSYYSYSAHNAHAFTIELGKVYPFGKNDLTRFSDLETSLRHLVERGRFIQSNQSNLHVFKVLTALIKDDESYQLNISDEEKNFTQFEEGYVLAHSDKSTYKVEKTGDAIVFPNVSIPVGQRAGLMVRAISLDKMNFSCI